MIMTVNYIGTLEYLKYPLLYLQLFRFLTRLFTLRYLLHNACDDFFCLSQGLFFVYLLVLWRFFTSFFVLSIFNICDLIYNVSNNVFGLISGLLRSFFNISFFLRSIFILLLFLTNFLSFIFRAFNLGSFFSLLVLLLEDTHHPDQSTFLLHQIFTFLSSSLFLLFLFFSLLFIGMFLLLQSSPDSGQSSTPVPLDPHLLSLLHIKMRIHVELVSSRFLP